MSTFAVKVIDMKRSLLIAFCLVICAGMAFGQGGTLGLYSDTAGLDCNLWDVVPGIGTYYVVHTGTSGATAVQFSAPKPACFLATYLADTAVFPATYGDSQTGVIVAYNGCYHSPIHVLSILYFCQALTAPCCVYRALPDPSVSSGRIEVADCSFMLLFAAEGCAIVNPNNSCPCQGTPVEESTWGGIKALYE
jgi:hypothetical protein